MRRKKKITFSSDYYGKALNYNGYQVSSFSSIGPARTSPSSRKLLLLVDRFIPPSLAVATRP